MLIFIFSCIFHLFVYSVYLHASLLFIITLFIIFIHYIYSLYFSLYLFIIFTIVIILLVLVVVLFCYLINNDIVMRGFVCIIFHPDPLIVHFYILSFLVYSCLVLIDFYLFLFLFQVFQPFFFLLFLLHFFCLMYCEVSLLYLQLDPIFQLYIHKLYFLFLLFYL